MAIKAVLAIIADGGRGIFVIYREGVEIICFLYFIHSAKTLRQQPRPTPCEEAPGDAVCSSVVTVRRATKLTIVATTTTMAMGDDDDDCNGATGNGATGYNDDNDNDNDGNGRRRQ